MSPVKILPKLSYGGGEFLGTPTRRDFVLNARETKLPTSESVVFLPIDVEDAVEFVDGKIEYRLRLTGLSADGTKTMVTVNNVDVFFDVYVREGTPGKTVLDLLVHFDANGIVHKDTAEIRAKKFFGYSEEPGTFIRVFFYDTGNRKKAIMLLREHGFHTASDDLSCYYRKVGRDLSVPFCAWLEVDPDHTEEDSRVLKIYASPQGLRKAKPEVIPEVDRTVIMTWDIEAYTDSGQFPDVTRRKDVIYMICATFHWKDSEEPFYRVCLVDIDTVPDSFTGPAHDNVQTVVCGSELNLLKAFSLLFYNMMPDIVMGFNDSDFDWPFVVERAKQYMLLVFMYRNMSLAPRNRISESDVYQWNYTERKVKTDADSAMFSKVFKVTGYVPIDVRVCMVRHYKQEEVVNKESLDFYLKLNELPPKEDLPIDETFKIYRNKDATRMAEIRMYCDRDAVSCHLLMTKQLILNYLRKVGETSYLSFWDAHYTANGTKVSNTVIEFAKGRGMLLSNIHTEIESTEKFKGAKVFSPLKGLKNKRPVLPFDYASLYPSLMQSFNISPDTYVDNEADAERLRSAGKNLFEIELEYGGKVFTAWYVRHDNDLDRMGLIPKILVDLLAMRNSIRKEQKQYPKKSLPYEKLEKEQLAIKVLMNSFYGVMGMKGHPLSLTAVALSVTTAGRQMINMVADYVQQQGWTIVYGDSVASYTPILARRRGVIEYVPMEKLPLAPNWQLTNAYRGGEKEFCGLPKGEIQVWTDQGWTNTEFIVRHKLITGKKMIRIVTTTGVVDVTDDHSLLTPTGERISPKDLKVGDAILHHDLPAIGGSTTMTSRSQKVLGEYLGKAIFKTGTVEIDNKIYNSGADYARHVWNGLVDNQTDNIVLTHKSQIHAAAMAMLATTVGFNVEFAYEHDICKLTCKTGDVRTPPSMILSMYEIPYEGYVYDITTENGHFSAGPGRIVVHNTDSLYLIPPDKYFTEPDADYNSGKISKLEYWTQMVDISMKLSDDFDREINDLLANFTGNRYLRMEAEDVKFPSYFTGKKKYAAIAHKGKIDFFPEDIFVKGIDFKKKGQTKMAVQIGEKILRQAFHIDNDKDVLTIVEDIFRDAIVNKDQWSIDDFIESKSYKPWKANITVNTFAERMRKLDELTIRENERRTKRGETPLKRVFEPPAPGQRFKYLVVRQKEHYDLRGLKINKKVGDLMEYVDVVKDPSYGHEIDISYYIKNKIVGLCARFINCDDRFAAPSSVPDDDHDEYSQKMAKRYLTQIVSKYVDTGIPHTVCKAAYKMASNAVERKIGDNKLLLDALLAGGEPDALSTVIVETATETVMQNTAELEIFAKKWLERLIGKDTGVSFKLHRALSKRRPSELEKMKAEIEEFTPVLRKVLDVYYDKLETLVLELRETLQSEDAEIPELEGIDVEELKKVRAFWEKLTYAIRADVRMDLFMREVDKLRNKKLSYTMSNTEIKDHLRK